ncbi:MAG: nitrile hydratase beta subunit [Flavobacterium sp.]|jgi:nitrile hydratase beta subunit
MDGIHDLGGMGGFGKINIEANEPVFHEDWEAFAYAAVFLGMGTFNADEYRHAVERIDPALYLSYTYYERVLAAATTLFIEKGIISNQELEQNAEGLVPLARPISKTAGKSVINHAETFEVGDRVRVKTLHATGHSRAPRYVHGKQGVVTHITPPFRVPDANAHGQEYPAQSTCHVRFEADELWRDSAEANTTVVVDLWQIYLEAI